jgi:D-alanine--poly(phosphoribitol) ligase subunit 2
VHTAEIASGIRTYICDRFNVPVEDPDFTNDVHLFDYGYVDSFGAVDLTLFVETQFTVKVSESDMVVYPLNTINEIAEFVMKRRSGEI